jgi:hypothetical protein
VKDERGARLNAVTDLITLLLGDCLELPNRSADLILCHLLDESHPGDLGGVTVRPKLVRRDLTPSARDLRLGW